MWFTFVTARLFHSLSFQPRLAAALLSSCSVANSPIRRVGLSPTLRSASLAQTGCRPEHIPGSPAPTRLGNRLSFRLLFNLRPLSRFFNSAGFQIHDIGFVSFYFLAFCWLSPIQTVALTAQTQTANGQAGFHGAFTVGHCLHHTWLVELKCAAGWDALPSLPPTAAPPKPGSRSMSRIINSP